MRSDRQAPRGTIRKLVLESALLRGNLLGDPAEREICRRDTTERACRCWSISSASPPAGRST